MANDIVPAKDYAVLQQDPSGLLETIQTNMGDEEISPFDLDAVKVPSGGGSAFEVPTLDGVEPQKELSGVIVHHKVARAFWRQGIEEGGGNTPPDCSSDDGKVGHGDPGGYCKTCPYSQFGSDAEGRGQACKQFRQLFLLPPDSYLPIVVTVPPTSLKNVKNYLFRLTSKQIPYYTVVTRLSLEKQKNSQGIEYSVIRPELGERLDEANAAAMKEYAEAIKPYLSAPIATASAETGDDGGE